MLTSIVFRYDHNLFQVAHILDISIISNSRVGEMHTQLLTQMTRLLQIIYMYLFVDIYIKCIIHINIGTLFHKHNNIL